MWASFSSQSVKLQPVSPCQSDHFLPSALLRLWLRKHYILPSLQCISKPFHILFDAFPFGKKKSLQIPDSPSLSLQGLMINFASKLREAWLPYFCRNGFHSYLMLPRVQERGNQHENLWIAKLIGFPKSSLGFPFSKLSHSKRLFFELDSRRTGWDCRISFGMEGWDRQMANDTQFQLKWKMDLTFSILSYAYISNGS